ncbi:glutaredoxin, partial [Saccharata proteae CBS 121410]
ESDADHEVDLEFNSILKKSPIIIFSKSYCPYSAKAKRILLDAYKISPPPYVVELDQHPLGPQLQAALAKSTGRRTVPNVLINGKSIGGGDDIEALHNHGKLAETVRSMGGKRIVEAALVEE